jgi:hypothetical protein
VNAWLAAFALAAALTLVGSRFAGALAGPRDGALHRLVLSLLAGTFALHLLVTALDFAGIPWTRWTLLLPLAAAFALAHRFAPRERTLRPLLPSDLGWGDALAAFGIAVFGLIAATLWVTTPDFVFHWGLKGARYFLARGVDYDYLARGWNWPIHPDYPNLLPELEAASALLAGRFEPAPMMLWSGVFLAAIVASAREALRQSGVERFALQAGTALVALVCASFGIGYLMAGAADWLPALAFVAALPALLRPPDREGDLQVGLAAAFAAASKIEGMPLALFLAAVQYARRIVPHRRIERAAGLDLPAALRLALPTAAVAIPWAARTLQWGLFQEFNSGPFRPERAGEVLRAALETLAIPEWHGFGFAAFLAPALLFARRLRPVAAVACLQLLFDFYVYFTALGDADAFVASNFARLLLQVVPALLVAGVIALAPKPSSPYRAEVSATPATAPGGVR